MQEPSKTNQELIEENTTLKLRIQELEKSEPERKRAEAALQESERHMKLALEGTDQGLWEWDILSRKVVYDENWPKIMNLPSEGRCVDMDQWLASMDAEGRAAFEINMTDYLAGRVRYYEIEHRLQTENKEWKWIWTRGIATERDPSGIPLRMIGTYRDITKQKQQEEALQESEEKHRLLIENSHDVIYTLTADGVFNFVSPAWTALLGHPLSQVVGHPFQLFVHPDDLAGCMAWLQKVIETGQRQEGVEYRVRHIDGSWRWHTSSAVPLRDEAGTIVGFEGIARDITDRKLSEEKLKVAEETYRNIFMNAQVGLFRTDMKTGMMLEANDSMAQFAGFKNREELFSSNFNIVERYIDPEARKKMLALIKEHGHLENFEAQFGRNDGEIRWIRFSAKLVPGKSWVEGVSEDITDRKQTEEDSRRLASVVRHSRELVNLVTPNGTMIFLNDAGKTMLGISEEEVAHTNLVEVIPEHLQDKVQQEILPSINRDGYWEGELQYRNVKTGGLTDVHARTFKITDPETGTVQFLANVSLDITDRKRAEEALRESETKLQAIFDTVGTGIIIIDKETQVIVEANQTAIEMTGLPKERIIGQICHSVVCPAQAGRCPVKDLGQSVDHSERKLLCADGHQRDILKTVYPITIKARECYVESFVDISDLKRAEEGLRQSKQQITDIIEFLPDATLAIDNDKRIIIWNRAIEEMTGIPAQEMIGKGEYAYSIPFYGEARPQLMDLVFKDSEEIANRYPQITREGDNLMVEVFCNALYDNRGAWVYAKAAPLCDQDGNVKGVIEIIRDITEQKRYENTLKDYQRNLADVINFLPDATFVIDKDGIVTAWNNAMVSMTGIKAEEMIGKGNYEYAIPFYGERRPIVIDLILSDNEEFLKKSYDAINYQEAVLSGEVYVPETFGGKGAYLWGNASRLCNASGEVIGAIQSIRDITDRKQADAERRELEERLNRAEKMESLGTMAGGVAHDLNNVLGVVVGYAELILMNADEPGSIRPHLVNIISGGMKAAAIVDDLLTLARRGVSGRKVLNLNEIIADCLQSSEFEKLYSYHPYVKIKTDLESDLLNISGSSVHLGKSLYNLVSNASEAMSKGGGVTIKTTNQYLDKPIHGYDKIREGDYVVLSVSDTGEGISANDLKRIFEPFYTKKVMGRSGTGLGLAVVWGTVKDHNGYINVQSGVGKGTTFTLYFPVTREDITAEHNAMPISEYMGQCESILVVDDVKEQRELAAAMLRTLNYSVTSVSSGEAAVEYLKEHQTNLMVLDMIMDPGMDGLDTYRSVLENRPKQKAIIVSGFSESDRVHAAQGLGAGAYIRKPYIIEKLGLAVRKELERE